MASDTVASEVPKPTDAGLDLKTSRFDVVRSLLMAFMLFIGVFVLMLFIVWLTRQLEFKAAEFPPIVENAAGRGENAEGFERDFEPPGAEEVEELMEPTLEDTLEAVTDTVSSVAASLDTMNTDSPASTVGTGMGDSRPAGPMGEGEDIVPRFERWTLKFAAPDVDGYAQQLDFYGIELGAIGGNIQGIDIASNLSGAPRTRRVDSEDPAAKRLYFRWVSANRLAQFDKQLLQQAGVPLNNNRIHMQFIPKNLENQLARIELDYAEQNGHPSITEVAKTVFESKGDGGGYSFEVIEQRYRR